MVLEATVTKKAVSKGTHGIYTVLMNLVLIDDDIEIIEDPIEQVVINRNFSQVHNPQNNISVARGEILQRMQDAIDDYKSSRSVYNGSAFTGAVAYINEHLEV